MNTYEVYSISNGGVSDADFIEAESSFKARKEFASKYGYDIIDHSIVAIRQF